MVVDDEPNIVRTLVLVLNHSDQNIFALGMTDLAEAMTTVSGVRPDLVLLDVHMPGAVELQHAVRMREQYGCKILLMSGHSQTAEVLDKFFAECGGSFEILAKPVHPTDLIRKIKLMLNEPPVLSDWNNPLNFHVQ